MKPLWHNESDCQINSMTLSLPLSPFFPVRGQSGRKQHHGITVTFFQQQKAVWPRQVLWNNTHTYTHSHTHTHTFSPPLDWFTAHGHVFRSLPPPAAKDCSLFYVQIHWSAPPVGDASSVRTTSLLPQDGVTDSTELHSFKKKKEEEKKSYRNHRSIRHSDGEWKTNHGVTWLEDRKPRQNQTLPDIKTQGQGDDGLSSTWSCFCVCASFF